MSHSLVNPETLHDPTSFGYSHTASIAAGARLVLVAGQWASTTEGRVAALEFPAQVRHTFDNLKAALAAHDLGLDSIVKLTTYVVDQDFDKLGAIGAAVAERWGAEPPVHTVVGVASLALPEILVEVEGIAVRQA